ncbi:hypothetical protein IT409_00880, partial [Candidatus Falkowbacteria bacterium]|nr:hypothetical protein [Candidatus Falkowbacteria bacterium]
MKNNRQLLHFTSHRGEIFVIQVCMTLAVLIALIYALYLVTFGRQYRGDGPITIPISDANNIVTSSDLATTGVNEDQFMNKAPSQVPQEKIES